MKSAAPDFLLAGAPRSGTTALTRYLEQHPQIGVCRPKEPHYLALRARGATFTGPGDDITINANSTLDHDSYAGMLDEARTVASIVGDGSVTGLYLWPDVATSLDDEFVGEPRIVLMLRNPVDRAYSSFLYQRQRGFEECDSFGEALERETQRRENGHQHMWHYRACSRYAEQIERLLADVPRSRVGVFIFEDFQADPQQVANDVATFLGADPFTFAPVEDVNRSGEPRSFAVAKMLRFARGIPAVRALTKTLTSEATRNRAKQALSSYPEMSASLRSDMLDEFAGDRRYVEQLTGRRLDAWYE